MEALVEDLTLVRSTCVVQDEFSWGGVDDELDAKWEAALTDQRTPSVPLGPPQVAVRLADEITVVARYHSTDPHDFEPTIAAASVDRDYQAELTEQVHDRKSALSAANGDSAPLFDIVSTLREWVLANPVPPTAAAKRLSFEAEAATRNGPPASTSLRLKVTLLWSHHLLATSKRKDIVQWSTELKLWGLSKPGYPGVIVVEGVEEQVDEFVYRIKQLQWKALQVRSETFGPELTPPSGLDDKVRTDWAVKTAHFAKVLGEHKEQRVCVREIEDMGELGEIMRRANLEDVFFSALKLNK